MAVSIIYQVPVRMTRSKYVIITYLYGQLQLLRVTFQEDIIWNEKENNFGKSEITKKEANVVFKLCEKRKRKEHNISNEIIVW